jgi:hypothetical protein
MARAFSAVKGWIHQLYVQTNGKELVMKDFRGNILKFVVIESYRVPCFG